MNTRQIINLLGIFCQYCKSPLIAIDERKLGFHNVCHDEILKYRGQGYQVKTIINGIEKPEWHSLQSLVELMSWAKSHMDIVSIYIQIPDVMTIRNYDFDYKTMRQEMYDLANNHKTWDQCPIIQAAVIVIKEAEGLL